MPGIVLDAEDLVKKTRVNTDLVNLVPNEWGEAYVKEIIVRMTSKIQVVLEKHSISIEI